MNFSESGRQLLMQLEGIEYECYHDSAGFLTIGCGHLLTKDELSSGKIVCNALTIRWKNGRLTDSEVEALLANDVYFAEEAVNNYVNVPLNQNQFDALVSFVFNIGTSAFRNSTLLSVLNRGNYDLVPEQMARWTKAGGRTIQGLIRRREIESDYWNFGPNI